MVNYWKRRQLNKAGMLVFDVLHQRYADNGHVPKEPCELWCEGFLASVMGDSHVGQEFMEAAEEAVSTCTPMGVVAEARWGPGLLNQ